MTKLERLYDIANKRNIAIVDAHFSNTKKAACLHSNDVKAVVLDKPQIASNAEEHALMAHEMGHYETGALYLLEATYNTPIYRSNRIKCEARARSWAITHTVSPEDIQCAIEKGNGDIDEMAEYCEVTTEFLQRAIEYYTLHGVVFQHTA
jgi:hypothetical protein